MDHDQPGLLSRWVRGDPPAQHAVDMYQRYGFFAAWLMGLVSIISGTIGLIAPAGLILASIGVLMFTNHQGLRDRMREREERSWALRITQQRQATKFGALLSRSSAWAGSPWEQPSCLTRSERSSPGSG